MGEDKDGDKHEADLRTETERMDLYDETEGLSSEEEVMTRPVVGPLTRGVTNS